jgi:hypothetical protein
MAGIRLGGHRLAAIFFGVGMIAVSLDGRAADIFVPADHATIQAAINAASDGDTIFVSPGTYREHEITFGGTNVRVVSTDGPDATTIDAQELGPVFVFKNGESRQASVEGFTITNGDANEQFEGGGVFITGSSPSIIGNHIVNNKNEQPDGAGGGIKVSSGSDPLIRDNLIQGNVARGNGGGMRLAGASGEIIGNEFINNTASGTFNSNGGAISLSVADSVEIRGNLFQGNQADSVAGAISAYVVSSLEISSNIFDANSAADFGGAMRLEDDRNESPMTALVVGNTFDGNTTQGEGGAIHAFFEDGEVETGLGGSVYEIVGNSFRNNVAEDPACRDFQDDECGDGGALQVIRQNDAYGQIIVRNNDFIGNHADLYGAAQFNKPDLVFEANRVENNTVNFRYAGISCENVGDAPCRIARNIFRGNGSTSGGSGRHNGGIYIKSPRQADVINNFFSQNSGERAGAIYYIDQNVDSLLRLLHNSFSDNVTGNSGGGSVWIDGDAEVTANIFSGDIRGIRVEVASWQVSIDGNNFSGSSSADVRVAATDYDASSLNAQGFAADNLAVTPGFVDEASGDLELTETSPLIDSLSCLPGVSLDYEADDRPFGLSCDIGADEFVIDTTIFHDRFEISTR